MDVDVWTLKLLYDSGTSSVVDVMNSITWITIQAVKSSANEKSKSLTMSFNSVWFYVIWADYFRNAMVFSVDILLHFSFKFVYIINT